MNQQEELKTKYGWSKSFEDFFLKSNSIFKSDYKGSFKIKKQNEKLFWYYQLSQRVKNRNKYLCSVEPKDLGKNQTSFEYCCNLLIERIQSDFTISSRNKSHLSSYIFMYEQHLNEEIIETYSKSRKKGTIKGMLSSITDFKRFCVDNDVKLYQVPQKEFKTTLINYIKDLVKREIKKSTIKSHIQDIRYFLDYLTNEKPKGLGVINSHPLTISFQNDILLNFYVPKPPPYEPKLFTEDGYNKIYSECVKRIRDIWTNYCKEGKLERIKDKNGKVNQPFHFLGRDIVWFVSLLQIRGGFRVGEVLYSYRSRDVYNFHHHKVNPKDMGSYWDKTEDGWVLVIKNSKGKDRVVPFTDTIRTWVEPPKHIKSNLVKDENGHNLYWDTNLIDVIMELFPNSFYTFPSPNQSEKPNQPRSITYYMNTFKELCVTQSNWEQYGIISSHNLRSFFISYSIRMENVTPLEVCTITGHSIQTMETYYLRENMKSKFNMMMNKLSQKELLTSSKKISLSE
jgi:integrase